MQTPPEQTAACRCTSAFACAGLAAVLLCAACATQASALDLGRDGLERDETFAYGQSLKRWDNVKMYGGERVIDRDRTMYQPDGIRTGNYLIFPSLGTRVIFDDN